MASPITGLRKIPSGSQGIISSGFFVLLKQNTSSILHYQSLISIPTTSRKGKLRTVTPERQRLPWPCHRYTEIVKPSEKQGCIPSDLRKDSIAWEFLWYLLLWMVGLRVDCLKSQSAYRSHSVIFFAYPNYPSIEYLHSLTWRLDRHSTWWIQSCSFTHLPIAYCCIECNICLLLG